jgi:hypothetical protein
MKIAIITILVLSAFSVALAVTVTAYSDTACATLAANPVLGVPNPIVGPLNTCIKSWTLSSGVYYSKISLCSSTSSVGMTYSGDSTCTLTSSGFPSAAVPGQCTAVTPAGSVPGVGSYILTCASAATSTIAYVAVAAAVFALCL